MCGSLADGCGGVVANIRECGYPGKKRRGDDGTEDTCGAQVWVSAAMTPLVDSGELRPMCWPCQHTTGQSVTLHDSEIKILTELGWLEQGWRIIAEINAQD